MRDTLDTIIDDLYALDPSLRERDADVRGIVESFLAAKPAIGIDDAFLSRLRAQLVERPRREQTHTPRLSFDAWMFRLVPLGAIALLIIILMPAIVPTEHGDVGGIAPQGTLMQQAPDAPSLKRSAETAPESFSIMQTTSDEAPTDSFTISPPQRAGTFIYIDFASLTQPGFIAIHRNEDGEPAAIIGVSPLLGDGLTERIEVPLTTPTTAGETYFGVLYRDTGDGVFDERADIVVQDASGVLPLSVLFSIEENIRVRPGI